jgi:hypothetical protein
MRAIALIALLLPLTVAAQVYSWKDANGKIHYSDQPPPQQGVKSRVLNIDKSDEASTAPAVKSSAEKRLDANQQDKEKKDAAAKAAKEKAEDEQRQRDCERARLQLQGVESGQIRYRMGPSGEREALDDSARQAELDNARKAVEASCSPRPKAKAPAPAPAPAPQKAPGY